MEEWVLIRYEEYHELYGMQIHHHHQHFLIEYKVIDNIQGHGQLCDAVLGVIGWS